MDAPQLVWFLDEDTFEDTDRPGFRRRIITVTTPTPQHEPGDQESSARDVEGKR